MQHEFESTLNMISETTMGTEAGAAALDNAMMAYILVRDGIAKEPASRLVKKYLEATDTFGSYLISAEAAYAMCSIVSEYSLELLEDLQLESFWRLVHDAAFHSAMDAMVNFDTCNATQHDCKRIYNKEKSYFQNMPCNIGDCRSIDMQIDPENYLESTEERLLLLGQRELFKQFPKENPQIYGYTVLGYSNHAFHLKLYF